METIVRKFGDDSFRLIKQGDQLLFSAYDVADVLKLEDPRRVINMIAIMEREMHRLQLIDCESEKVLFVDHKFIIKMTLRASYTRQVEFLTCLIRVIREETLKAITVYPDGYDNSVKSNYFAITQIAKAYGMSATKLNSVLAGQMIQYKVNDQWVLFAPYQDQGYTVSVPYKKGDGETVLHTYWTEKGLKFIDDVLTKIGYIKNSQLSFDISNP